MEFRLLGPVEIISDTGEIQVLAREKERRLLAVLLMNAGHVLSKEKLISHLADEPGGITDSTLRAYLHRVKRVITAAGGSAELVTREGGYQLRVPDDCIDVRRFTRLRHQADVAAHAGATDQAVALLCEAEALWYGAALSDLEGQWALATGHGLDEERRSCTLRRIGLQLDLGRHTELLGELRRLRAQYPYDEIRAAHEMKALYWSGRQEDALDVYRQIWDSLVEQGLEPGPALVELHQKILHRNLAPTEVIRKPPASANTPEVPLRETAFVGRETDLETLTSVGPGTPQVWVISGLSGVGKTRLALEAARRLAGEILFLEFNAKDDDQAPLDVDGALRRLLEQAGIDRSALQHGRAKLAELWQRELADRQMTVILDDVPDAGAIEPLLPKTGSCRVFITARQRLHGIVGASGRTLDVLPESDAVALFREISGEADISSDDIAAAVRRCRCLPMVITIEAGRLRQDGRLLASGGAAATSETGEMSEQLQLVLDSCYQALAAEEQKLFRFLGVNPCPSFTTESAAALVGVPVHAAGEMVSVLFDRHLVDHTMDGGFRLHDLLRDYAAMGASRNVSRRDRHDAERRLLDYYLREADRADRELYPHRRRTEPSSMVLPSQRSNPDLIDRARRWMETEWRNALAAAEYAGRHEWRRYCIELAHLLANFLDIRGYFDEAVGVHTQALHACRDLDDRSCTARALVDLSRSSLHKGQHQAALAHAREALNIYRSLGDLRGEAEAADRIGVAHYQSGEFREALAYEQEARDLYAQVSDLAGENEAVYRCGVVCMELGRLSESISHFGESMEISERSGDSYSMATTLNSLGEVSRRQGYHRDALIYYRKSLLICRRVGAVWESAIVMQNIGHVHLYKGNCERALTEFRCALAIFRQINDLPGQARVMCDFGDAYLAMEDYEQGLVYYKDAVSAAEQVGNLHVQLIAMRGIADSLRGADRHEESIECYREALVIAQRLAVPYQQATVLHGLAEAMLRSGQVGAGRIYLRQAYDLYQAAGAIEAESTRLRLQILGVSTVGGNAPLWRPRN